MKCTTQLFLLVTVLTLFNCQKDSLDLRQEEKASSKYEITSLFDDIDLMDCNQIFHKEIGKSRSVASTGNKWENGKNIKVKFLDEGTSFIRNKVKTIAKQWIRETSLKLEFVTEGESDIRITFDESEGYWSNVGKITYDPGMPTMNLGGLGKDYTEESINRVILHEFGHALGLQHEHQHPGCPIEWDIPALTDHYINGKGWTQDKLDLNILYKYDVESTERTKYDINSIMHYGFEPKFNLERVTYYTPNELSANDLLLIKRMYPQIDQDGDGFHAKIDCDDNNPAINSDAFDIINNGIDENCSGKDRSILYQISSGGTSDWAKLNRNEGITANQRLLVVGDFDGNQQDDILKATNNVCEIFPDGSGNRENYSNTLRELGEDLQVGDFNGDGKDDLLELDGIILYVTYYGGSRRFLRTVPSSSSKVEIGDFDGDGRSEVAIISKASISYNSSRTGKEVISYLNTFQNHGYLIGDFNGDGKDDIFSASGKKWRVLHAGEGTWTVLRDHAATTDQLQVGYFDGLEANGRNTADIFLANGTNWKIYAGGEKVKQLQTNQKEDNVFLGDFDGDGTTDVMRIREIGE